MDWVLVSSGLGLIGADSQWIGRCHLAGFCDHLSNPGEGIQCQVEPVQVSESNTSGSEFVLTVSNGASPAALWLGHILFELPAILLVSTIITIIFAVASSQFNYPGMVWICFVLYGISSTLYAYLFTLGLKSPLASWALVAGFNVILFLLYL